MRVGCAVLEALICVTLQEELIGRAAVLGLFNCTSVRQPAARVRPERVSVDSKGQAPQSTATLVAEAAAPAFGRFVGRVPQGAYDRAFLVNVAERGLKDIARPDRHPPAGVNIAVRHDGEE